jgi:hypothetical protein
MSEKVEQLASSRPIGVATELSGNPIVPEVVFSKKVILTGETSTLLTQNGRWCFLDSLRLLSRVIGNLDVLVPPEASELHTEIDQIIDELWSQGTVQRVHPYECDFRLAAAILNVGYEVRLDLPWTAVCANGWVARCTSGPNRLPAGSEQANPVASLLAASLGVTEVFKRIYDIPENKAPAMQDVAFSLFEMSADFPNVGPKLPDEITLPNTLLLGAGAIGNGLTLLMSQLPLKGRVLLMDKQNFAPENYGTCTLLDRKDWLYQAKATQLAAWLRERSGNNLEVKGEMCTIEEALEHGKLGSLRPELVINGLDDVKARKSVQRLWPSLLVDGAINSAGAAVVTHSMQYRRFACLQCAFAEPEEDHIALQARATGLVRSSLEGNQNRMITDEDIANANPEYREFLREQQRKGKTICATIPDAYAQRLGLNLEKGFRPSVPFVATASATLVIAQVLRNLLWPEKQFWHEFQFASLFVGPSTAQRFNRLASADCDCTKNANLIEAIQAQRRR